MILFFILEDYSFAMRTKNIYYDLRLTRAMQRKGSLIRAIHTPSYLGFILGPFLDEILRCDTLF